MRGNPANVMRADTLNMGGRMADPASPYSYEVISCGRIFSL